MIVVAVLLLFGSFGMGGYGMMGFGMGFGFLFMLLFLCALIWLTVTLVNTTQSGKKEENMISILKRRYAAGEITQKQYEKMKREIRRK